jgi:ABC-type phosphate transport system substrate-binding protein
VFAVDHIVRNTIRVLRKAHDISILEAFMIRLARIAATFIVAAGGLLAARSANAQDAGTTPDCTTLMNPVYLTGSSAYEATLKAFAVKLAAETPPTTVVYQKPGSCIGVAAIQGGTALTGTGIYYTLNGTTITSNNCTFPSAGPLPDVGVSDVFYESCTNVTPTTRPATLGDFFGPVQAMEIIVPKSNTTTQYITAQEAQDIWGCGYTANIATFTVNGGIFCRDYTSGTQIIVSDAAGLNPMSVLGVNAGSSGTMASDVAGFATPMASIGFIGADVYDADRTTLNALAFQAFGQTKAYFADSSATAVDRQNVRDGHYFPWGYEHFFAKVASGTTTIADTKAASIIGLLTGTTTDPSFDYVQVDGKAGTIPLCAMSVQKSNDLPGYLAPYSPTDTCNCDFLTALSGTAPASCMTCNPTDGGVGTCTTGKSCHHGYCE